MTSTHLFLAAAAVLLVVHAATGFAVARRPGPGRWRGTAAAAAGVAGAVGLIAFAGGEVFGWVRPGEIEKRYGELIAVAAFGSVWAAFAAAQALQIFALRDAWRAADDANSTETSPAADPA